MVAFIAVSLPLSGVGRHHLSKLELYARQSPAQVNAEITACFVRHGQAVEHPGYLGEPGGEVNGPGGVAFLTKIHSRTGKFISWAVDRENVDGQRKSIVTWYFDIPGSRLNANPCYAS